MPILTTFIFGSAAGAVLLRLNKPGRSQTTFASGKKSLLLKRKARRKAKKDSLKPAEKQVMRHQRVSILALGTSAAALVTTGPVKFIALPFLLYNYLFFLAQAKKAFNGRSTHKHKISLVVLDFISLSATLVTGLFFTTALLFLTFFTAMRLTAKAERDAHIDFNRIFGELSDTVWINKEGAEIQIPLKDVKANDIVVVRAGEMIPVDGEVVSGEGSIDQHLLTGESQPIDKVVGDQVLASTLVITGHLEVCVKHQGSETITGQIAKTLEHAATYKSKVQARSDRIVEQGATWTLLASAVFLPFVGITRALSLTYSGFGYQMRMAAPLMILNYLRVASGKGILVKDGRALDALQQVDTIVFDKTGTLTEEVPTVRNIMTCQEFTSAQVLQYAASAEQRQTHPVALAISENARQAAIELLEVKHTDYAIGHGLEVELNLPENETLTLLVGSHRLMSNHAFEIPENIQQLQNSADKTGHSVIYVGVKGQGIAGAIELKPTLREQTKETIQTLKKSGVDIYIISGDRKQPTAYMANDLGIDHYFAETLPEDKAKHVKRLQEAGRKVCFVGDGINDSVALQAADVSVSLHGAATIAQDTADIVLMKPDLLLIPEILTIAGKLNKRMHGSEVLNNASGAACISGVIFFGMGLGGATLLYSGGLLINIGNAMMPLFKETKKNAPNNHISLMDRSNHE